MYPKMVWCYVFILTLLDISLNTNLTAQGKSHGVTVQDPLRFIERIPFQEAGAGRGAAAPAEALRLSPPALSFGRCALARPHALSVTLTNMANGTMHLASVAGTTPDFHASFFDSKTLPPAANTTFSVVYLGRREGAVAAHLYIHTSLGVIKYPVSAEGVASEWDVWPLVGLRVPHNATVDPLLTMHNPTEHTIQVSEVYSSGAWLGLQLPDGEQAAPRALWTLPPHTTRPLVRLRPQLPPPAPHPAAAPAPLTAYIRIKASVPGGSLVVPVEARPAPAGEYLQPLQLRLRARGSGDPPHTSTVLAGSSAAAGGAAHAALWAARCGPAPHAAPPPYDHDETAYTNGLTDKATANGVKAAGVLVSPVRAQLDAHQPPAAAAHLSFDFAKMWETYVNEMEAEGAAAGPEAWCAGWVRVGRAAMPYSVKLLPGTLRLLPAAIHVVTAEAEEALRPRPVRVLNELAVPLRLLGLQLGPGVAEHFHVVETEATVVPAGETLTVGHVRLRAAPAAHVTLDSWLAVRTNGSVYRAPLRLHGGRLALRWQWPHGEGGELRLGAVGTSSTRRVRLHVHNPAPAPLCVHDLRAELPGAQLALDACAANDEHCRCVPPGGWLGAWLTVVAPAREGPLHGTVLLRTQYALTEHNVTLHAYSGRLHAHALHLHDAAPYASPPTPLVVESSMALSMRALGLHHDRRPPDALNFVPAGEADIAPGRHTVGALLFAPEKLCEPDCYTGLDLRSPEGVSWLRRGAPPELGTAAALAADAALWRSRRALFAADAAPRDLVLHLQTTQVLQLPVTLHLRAHWPRLALRAAPAALAGVGASAPLQLAVANPSTTHALLLQPLVAGRHDLGVEAAEAEACGADCVWDSEVFSLGGWRVAQGVARAWHGDGAQPAPDAPDAPDPRDPRRALPPLLLEPRAEILVDITFTPREAAPAAAYLYLRNNLTIVESVPLRGRGVYPSFELGGRRPGAAEPLLFEVVSCEAEAGGVRRTLAVRNTGAVPLRLRDWRLAGRPCAARGFRLQPCAPLALRPNESRALHLAFTPDYTLARVPCPLTVRTDTARAEFALAGAAPARLLPACTAALPRPPFDAPLRAAGTLLALAALALVLAAGALDAERELRRARADRPPAAASAASRQPLDLRTCHVTDAAPAQPATPAAAPRRRRPPRRPAPLDPQAERRAFERWRAEVLRRAPAADDHSSEDADAEPDAETDCTPPSEPAEAGGAARGELRLPAADDDAASSASDSSSPPDERYEPEEAAAAPRVLDHKEPECRWSEEGARGAAGAGASARRGAARGRPGSSRTSARREKPARRRGAGGPARSPPRAAPAPPPAPRPPRRAATWSEVVAEGAPAAEGAPPPAEAARLAPIGSDLRRRGAHSLFYYNESPPPAEPAFAWRPQPADTFPSPPAHLYREESNSSVGAVGSGAYSSPGSVWGVARATPPPAPAAAAAAWLWGGYGEPTATPALRPPPGFGAAPRVQPPPPPRAYDPFRSLAAIWGPAALDWRAEPDDAEPDAAL